MKSIISPLPGTFYRRPSPDKDRYVEVGDSVKAGDVIGLVEVMKSFQEIKAEEEGTIKEIKVEDQAVVDAGQIIAELD